ncbi:MAG: DUF4865 family protein [Ramlibacter sp.]
MLITQYAFTLPTDYPMQGIRERIAVRGPQFDALPGLGWKAFLVRESGVSGATDNQYAPLYLWPTAEAAGAFLAGPHFAGVAGAFGRPSVSTSILLRHHVAARAHRPRWCTSEHQSVPMLSQLQAHLSAFEGKTPAERHSAWLALDTSRWVLSCHQLWCEEKPPAASHASLYEVAHFSRPA